MFGIHVLGNAPAPSAVGWIADHFHTSIATSLQAAIVAFGLSGVLFLMVAPAARRNGPRLCRLSPDHVDIRPHHAGLLRSLRRRTTRTSGTTATTV